MKEYVLNYYPKFKCIADKCKHTCCAGWEISIDKKSLDEYMNCDSNFWGALKKGINYKKSKFKVDKAKRCAFLNADNLCEIIINKGEKSLCQVCRDHPRFRSFFNDREELGLGFCCEQATKIILSYNDKIQPILINDDNNPDTDKLDFIQGKILGFRQVVLDIVQDRDKGVEERLEGVLSVCNARIEECDFTKVIKAFLSLERLDKNWTKRLKSLRKIKPNFHTEIELSLCFEQFMANGFYRHLSGADDTITAMERAVGMVVSWWLIKSIWEVENAIKTADYSEFDILFDIVREYSAEVEYSQKNLDKLFNFASKLIKI